MTRFIHVPARQAPETRLGLRLLVLIGLLLNGPAVLAQGNTTIESIAGGGPRDVPALEVALFPEDVAVDTAGNIYFTSRFRHRIYRVDHGGILRLVAGTGIELGMGDGGPIDRAGFLLPDTIALDPAENLVVYGGGDAYGCCNPDFSQWNRRDHLVRRLDFAAGQVDLVTDLFRGGVLWPNDMAIAPDGTIFAANHFNFGTGGAFLGSIYEVDPVTGVETRIAGKQGNPGGPVDDGLPATDIYLERVDSVALAPSGELLLADRTTLRIRTIDGTTGLIGTHGPAAGLYGPLAFDGSGNLHVLERSTVWKIDGATGAVSVAAGTGIPGFGGDGGQATDAQIDARTLTFDPSGGLYLAGNGRIRRVDPATGIIDTVAGDPGVDAFGDGGPATQAFVRHPEDIALDPAGNLYIAEAGYTAIRKVDSATGEISSLFRGAYGDTGPTGTSPASLRSVAYHDGALYYSTVSRAIDDVARNFDRVYRYDLTTGVTTRIAGRDGPSCEGDGGPAVDGYLDGPEDLVFDAAGNLYIADADNSLIRRVDGVTGVITTVAGIGTATWCRTTPGFNGDGLPADQTQLSLPSGLAFDPVGNLHIADRFNHRIRRVDAATGIVSTVAGTGVEGSSGDGGPAALAELSRPRRIEFDSVGNLYIAGDERLRRVDRFTGKISTLAGDGVLGFHGDGGPAAIAGLGGPRGMAFDASGDLLVTSHFPGRIRRIDLPVSPVAIASATPSILWPPGHAMVEVHVDVDTSATPGVVTVELVSITSSEDDDAPGGSDGSTVDDIRSADFGTADFDFELRAERAGNGPGRVYTIVYLLTSEDGGISTATTFVTVPHDMGGVVDPVQLTIEETDAGTLLSWEEIPGANSTSVIRGEIRGLADLPDAIDLGEVVCIESRSKDLTTLGDEDAESPDPGQAWFYAAEYRDPHASTYGSVFAPKPRVPGPGACN